MLPLSYSQSTVSFVLTSSLEVSTLVTSLTLSITTFLLTCANISTVLGVLQERGGQGVPGHWSKNRRWADEVTTIRFHLCLSYQARYFKNMLREANHFEQVKQLRIGEKDVAALVPAYEVHFSRPWQSPLTLSEVALGQLRDACARTEG